jgi:hypothetical protein
MASVRKLTARASHLARRAYSFVSSWDRIRGYADRQQLHLRFRRAVRESRPIHLAREGDVQVHLLFGHRHVHEVVGTIQSLYRFLPSAWPVVLHEDGSLTAGDRALIHSLLVGVRIIDRKTADSEVLALLEQQGLVRCAAMRRTFVLALKLLDVQLYARGASVLLLDTDVLFHRPPHDLIEGLTEPSDRWVDRYNEDFTSSYAWSTDTIRARTGIEILPSVNTGLVALRRPTVNWTRYEEWLAIPDPIASMQHLEQTLYALEFTIDGARALPAEYDVMFRSKWQGEYETWLDRAPGGADVSSQHYCGSEKQRRYYYRHYLDYVARAYRR